MALTKVSYSMISGAAANVLDYGADPTGATDSYAAIQAAVNASSAVFLPSGTYLVSQEVQLNTNSFLFGAGKTSVIKKTTETVPYCVSASNKQNITIKDLSLDGSRVITTFQNSIQCLYVTSCDKVTVENVHAYGARNDGLVFEFSSNVLVSSCYAYNNNKVGIYFSGCDEVVCVGNTARANGGTSVTGSGIGVAATWNASIVGNTCVENVESEITIARGSRFVSVTGNTLGGTFNSTAPNGVWVNAEQIGGTLHGFNYGPGTTYWGAWDCTITGNAVFSRGNFQLFNSSVVAGNFFSRSVNHGLYFEGCGDNCVSDNVISTWTAGSYGVALNNAALNGGVQSDTNQIKNNVLLGGSMSSANAYGNFGTGANNLFSMNSFRGSNYVNGAVIQTPPTTVAGLVAAATAGAGTKNFVSDATATTFGTIVAGGGANSVPVYSDGTNWRIG